jgi:hypothetical protein
MKKLPRAGGAGRLSVARGVYPLSGGSFFKINDLALVTVIFASWNHVGKWLRRL